MLTESELKRQLGLLGIEERGDQTDWYKIARLSAALLNELPEPGPQIVRAYLTDSDIRRVSVNFANSQRSELIEYLRS